MNRILKYKWIVIALWIIVTIGLSALMPDLEQLAVEKGQPKIPDNYSSVVGSQLEKEMKNQDSSSKEMKTLVIFGGESVLTESQKNEIKSSVEQLRADAAKLHITEVVSPFDSVDLEKEMISEDDTTLLVEISADKSEVGIDSIREDLNKELSNVSVAHYLTGGDLINSDMAATSHEGTKRTEIFTYAAIFLILLIIFRSPVTPFASLLSIGLTYICSRGIVTQLVNLLGFPYSTSTQTFLIVVLFGIGTDYNILLLMRFREELRERSVKDAILTTYKTAGKTVFLSSLTVLVGFAVLSLAKFSIFQSASAVAIAVVVLLLELLTILPCLMALLGEKLFWPAKPAAGHGKSKLWEKVSFAAVKKPVAYILIVLVVTMPVILLMKNNLSYDNLHEVDSSYNSVKGVDLCADKFGPGKIFPVNIMIKNATPMDNNEALAAIDKINESVSKLEGVGSVYSATRPKGEKLTELYINDQAQQVNQGLQDAIDGVNDVQSGLESGSSKLPESIDANGVDDLISGTAALQTNLDKITSGLKQVNSGLMSGAEGASTLDQSLNQLEASAVKLNQSTGELLTNYQSLQSGLSQLYQSYKDVESKLDPLLGAVGSLNQYSSALGQKYPQMASDQAYLAMTKTISGLSTQMQTLKQGLATLNGKFSEALTSMEQLNGGLSKISAGQSQISAGIEQMKSGSDSLKTGLTKGAAGQTEIISKMAEFKDGLQQVSDGQLKMKDGLDQLTTSLPDLKSGLSEGSDGLKQVSEGLVTAQEYMNSLSADASTQTFYIPADKLSSADFTKSLDTYMSADRTITRITVYLSIDPYSAEALDVVDNIEKTVEANIQSGPLDGSTIGISGVTSQNRDLSLVSNSDLTRSKIIMLLGIAVLLIFITRSILQPIVIVAALGISYYASYTITQLLFNNVFGIGNLTWTAPFFSFIMLIPLGVDYSIFLIRRYRETGAVEPGKAIVEAASKTGGIIISAAIILSATFAALYSARITSLAELATAVIIGLLLLAFVFMPIFLPACMSLTEKIKSKFKHE